MLTLERIREQNRQIDATDGLTPGQIHELITAGRLCSTDVPPSAEFVHGTCGVLITHRPLTHPGEMAKIDEYERLGLTLADYKDVVFDDDALAAAQDVADGRGFGETAVGALCALIFGDDADELANLN